MSDTRSRTSEVEVAVDALTAFTVFTDELDLWWVRGPINNYSAHKVVAMRCEPGVGGRLLEVFDHDTGEGLELARITAWEPGKFLAWQSSIDDVAIEVRFEPTDSGTNVRLDAIIPDDGADRGGTAWIRVTPGWFAAWAARRDTTPHELHDLARFGLTVHYARPAAAARWVAAAFGFEAAGDLPQGDDPLPETEHGHPWIEFRVGNCSLMLDKLEGPPVDLSQDTHRPWVFVDNLDAHLERARDNGATIVQGITSYGFTSYVARDLEGRSWRFAQARPTQPR
jgi:uncharacterized glyoxalase superfamily protein PhnB